MYIWIHVTANYFLKNLNVSIKSSFLILNRRIVVININIPIIHSCIISTFL